MRKNFTFIALPLLLSTLCLSACSSPAPAVSAGPSKGAVVSAPADTATPSASADATPAPAQTPSGMPGSGLYMLVTGEPGEAEVSIVHYYGDDSVAQKKEGDNYKEQVQKVKVPGYVEVKLANLSQITEKATKDGQLLGCDFYYNGELRPQNTPYNSPLDAVNYCYSTDVAESK